MVRAPRRREASLRRQADKDLLPLPSAMSAVGQALAHLGLREKPSKREGPSRSGLNFLGIGVDTSGSRVTLQVPQHRKVRLRTLVADFLRLQKEGSRVIGHDRS